MVVNTDDYSYEKVETLREKISDIRRMNSIFSKYPMEEEETKERWKERVEPLMEADMTRKDGESVEDHMRRMFELKSDTHEMVPAMLAAVSEVFGTKAPAEEDLKKANFLQVKAFLFDVLDLADVPAGDLLPKKPLSN